MESMNTHTRDFIHDNDNIVSNVAQPVIFNHLFDGFDDASLLNLIQSFKQSIATRNANYLESELDYAFNAGDVIMQASLEAYHRGLIQPVKDEDALLHSFDTVNWDDPYNKKWMRSVRRVNDDYIASIDDGVIAYAAMYRNIVCGILGMHGHASDVIVCYDDNPEVYFIPYQAVLAMLNGIIDNVDNDIIDEQVHEIMNAITHDGSGIKSYLQCIHDYINACDDDGFYTNAHNCIIADSESQRHILSIA